ncbi:MAG TPA: ABC transporter permease [Verrucomicrobiae bacterium]|jgi:predicted permease|nr:ABC transporter permease [Verrucomicrobiae bacterium]
MRSLRRFFTRMFSSATRRAQDERLREEIEEHIALGTAENIRAGLSAVEARRQAILKFGGVEATKEDYRAERGLPLIENLLQDVRFSLRVLRKSPGFTLTAVLTLAMAIGANAIVFGVIDALILHPLNLPQEDGLYAIQHGSDNSPSESYPDYLDLRARNRSFDDLAAYTIGEAGLDTGENPSRAWVYEVTGNYFDVLAIQPYLGRFFHSSDEHGPNSAPYVVLPYTFWHSHFQDDRSVVGRVVQLNKHPFTVLGVAPPGFHGTIVFLTPDLFVPVVNREQVEGWNDLSTRGKRWLHLAMGHLKSGVTPPQAIADLNSVGAYLERSYPNDDSQMTFSLARPGLLGDVLGRPARAFLAGLMLLAGLILLAACANLGSLFAARAADRSREVALRLALGSSRSRVLRQVFTEALLISLIGGAVGVWGSIGLLHGLSAWRPSPQYPVYLPVNPGANVYAMALLLAVISGFLFGAVPVRQILRTDAYAIIKSGPSGRFGRRNTFRDLLLAAQIAICAVLVTSSLVAVRGMVRSLHSNFGFEPQNAMLADTDLTMSGYKSDQVPAMQRRMIEALETIPGVTSVGLVDWSPLSGGAKGTLVFTEQTSDFRPVNAAASALMFNISPEYFRAAGTSLLSGRAFTRHDDKDAPPVAVINQEFARKIFGSADNALGRYYKTRDGTRMQVVGIVEDGKYESLTEEPQPAVFLPILQSPSSETYLVVRGDRDPQQLATDIRSKLREVDAGLPFFIQTWNQQLRWVALLPSRLAMLALGVLGVMGAMLALTGIFGMAAQSVSKRLKELGIRVALGAQRKDVLQAALGRAFKLLAFGSAAGLLLGILASRVLASIVYHATPRDPLVLSGVVLAMVLLGLLATWIPARRALSVDPLLLLREE